MRGATEQRRRSRRDMSPPHRVALGSPRLVHALRRRHVQRWPTNGDRSPDPLGQRSFHFDGASAFRRTSRGPAESGPHVLHHCRNLPNAARCIDPQIDLRCGDLPADAHEDALQ